MTAIDTPVSSLSRCTDMRSMVRATRNCVPVAGLAGFSNAWPVLSLSISKLRAFRYRPLGRSDRRDMNLAPTQRPIGKANPDLRPEFLSTAYRVPPNLQHAAAVIGIDPIDPTRTQDADTSAKGLLIQYAGHSAVWSRDAYRGL